MVWLLLVLTWVAVAIGVGLVLGAAVRRAEQLEAPGPYADLLRAESRQPVAH